MEIEVENTIRDTAILVLRGLLPYYEIEKIDKHAFDCFRNRWMRYRVILKYSWLGESPWEALVIQLERSESASSLWRAEISTQLTHRLNNIPQFAYQMQAAMKEAVEKFIAEHPSEIKTISSNSLDAKLDELRSVLPPFLVEKDTLKLLNKLIEHFRWMPGSEEYQLAEENFEALRDEI